jgi:phosphoenolpyruvate synthase/pyruvate phosphate dikinase
MLLAERILNRAAGEQLKRSLRIPDSYFLGSDLMYIFMSMNGLMHWNDQKYKPEDQIRTEYSQIQRDFASGRFPPEILVELQSLLEKFGNHPIIVRSSSQLEDNLGTSFAGKYDSSFCPNQGTPQQNLLGFTDAAMYAAHQPEVFIAGASDCRIT